jgi:apolipoprotein D and lipocalin family protein
MIKTIALAAVLALAPLAASATPMTPPAVLPQPAKPVPPQLYSGRWYEIARTPNSLQTNCQAATNDFANWDGTGVFKVVETCRQGSPTGPRQSYGAGGKVLAGSANAKMRLGFMGGIVQQEYWILDHADNGSWAIMDRSDGRYVWLLSRQPVLDPATRAAVLGRIHQLGFDLSKLSFPQQPPAG